LFATHYHELTALAGQLPHLANFTLGAKEWTDAKTGLRELVFLHAVQSGAADRSYGIHVARLAGLPRPVIARAEAILATLESGQKGAAAQKLADLPLFTAVPAVTIGGNAPAAPSPTLERLAALDPDALTAREALDLIYALARSARDETK